MGTGTGRGRPAAWAPGSGAGRSLARARARRVAPGAHAPTGTHARRGAGVRWGRLGARRDYMLCPGARGARARGALRRDRACRRGGQSEPDPPAQSVPAAAGGARGPARTMLTAAPPAARAPATRLGAAGARGPLGEGRSRRRRRRARGGGAGTGRRRLPGDGHGTGTAGRRAGEGAGRAGSGARPSLRAPEASRRPRDPRPSSGAGGDAPEPAG